VRRDTGCGARGGGERAADGEQRPIRDDNSRNCGTASHWARECRLPRRNQVHIMQAVVDGEPALFLAHRSIECAPAASNCSTPP
jgi:hypothetical protein